MADKNYPLIIVTHTIATLSNKIGYLAPKSSLLILFQFLAYFVRYAIIKADFITAIGRNPYWLQFWFGRFWSSFSYLTIFKNQKYIHCLTW